MPLAPPQFDPVLAVPAIGTAKAMIAVRDWTGFRNLFISLDWAGRGAIVGDVDTSPETGEFLRATTAADPGDAVAATARASHLINAGWEIRTSARATNVSAEQFRALHDHLRQAERILIEVTAREPVLAPAWDLRLVTARGLELGQAEARRRYDRLAQSVPNHMPGQIQLLQQLCPKWSGSFEKVHAFGRECMLGAPEGALNAAIVADGHMEHWFDLGSAERARYVENPAVHTELAEAADRSVLHHDFRRTTGWVWALNIFAAMLCVVRDYPRAVACFNAIGHLGSKGAWDYLGKPEEVFVQYRNLAFAKGGVR